MWNALFIDFSSIFPFNHYAIFSTFDLLCDSIELIQVIVSPSYIVNFFFGISPLIFFFMDELWHENYVNPVISICHNYFWNEFHPYHISTIKTFIQKVPPTSIYHPKSSLMLNFHPCTFGNFFSHVIFTWHGDILGIFCPNQQNIPKRSFLLMSSCSHVHFITSLLLKPLAMNCCITSVSLFQRCYIFLMMVEGLLLIIKVKFEQLFGMPIQQLSSME